jgi:hypothetical protein
MSKQKPKDYEGKDGAGKYPDAPGKCPYGSCGIGLKMKKNGFYTRHLITITNTFLIRVRRYKCPKCGRTLSMLPSFCVAGFSYGVDFVFALLQYVTHKDSARKTVREWRSIAVNVSRRLIAKYLSRLRNNRLFIQYAINQISPDNISLGRLSGDTDWTKGFLLGIRPTLSPEFNADFHKTTGNSFMSLHNRISQPAG